MRSLKNILFISAVGFVLSGCGGGGGGGSIAPIVVTPPAPQPSAQSERDRQTNAARDQFEKNLTDALAASNEWLDNNRREAGVVTTSSGLQYRIDKSSPNPAGQSYEGDQAVTFDYEGSLADGTIFDSSFERGRPETLKPSELIEGWQEALALMQPGDEWTLFIPPSLGYGDLGQGASIPPNAVLIFKAQLR